MKRIADIEQMLRSFVSYTGLYCVEELCWEGQEKEEEEEEEE